jgi:hypothetical protein
MLATSASSMSPTGQSFFEFAHFKVLPSVVFKLKLQMLNDYKLPTLSKLENACGGFCGFSKA